MPRSDGNFPSYVRLKIDPDLWPDNYWDESRRCIGCERHWPNTHLFEICPGCGRKTGKVASAPDMRWPEAISALVTSRFEALYEIWNEGVEDEQLEWEDVKTDGKLDNNKLQEVVDNFLGNVKEPQEMEQQK